MKSNLRQDPVLPLSTGDIKVKKDLFKQKWLMAFNCRLCWKVTVRVFISILCIEGAILFFSIDNFKQDREMELEREAVVLMRAILRAADTNGELSSSLAEIAMKLRANSVLLGAAVFAKNGRMLFSFGEQPAAFEDIGHGESTATRHSFPENIQRLDLLWPPQQLKAPYFVAARIDRSEIDQQTQAFIGRIIGLVLLISVFVTGVCLLVLESLIFSPIRELNRRMCLAGSDPSHPSRHAMHNAQQDELGDIVRTFNTMLCESDANLNKIRTQQLALRQHAEDLDAKIQDRTREVLETQLKLIQRLGRASEFRDNETGNHIIRMSRSCQLLALAAGLNEEHAECILHASPMHDVGKIGIRDEILLKPGKLTEDEFEIMKCHAEIGADIIGVHQSPVLEMARTIALCHHEKWDGSGYPRALAGEDIPIEARIAAICDVFDALTSIRPYKKAWLVEDAIGYLRQQAGKGFEPRLVELFIRLIPEVLVIRDDFADPGPA